MRQETKGFKKNLMKVEFFHVNSWWDAGIFGTMQITAAGRCFTTYCHVLAEGGAGCQRSPAGCLCGPKGSSESLQHLVALFSESVRDYERKRSLLYHSLQSVLELQIARVFLKLTLC